MMRYFNELVSSRETHIIVQLIIMVIKRNTMNNSWRNLLGLCVSISHPNPTNQTINQTINQTQPNLNHLNLGLALNAIQRVEQKKHGPPNSVLD